MSAGAETRWGPVWTGLDAATFRIWAPDAEAMTLRIGEAEHPMQGGADGWFTADITGVSAGAPYSFILPDGLTVPDPAARAQAGDVHGPSLVTDPDSYRWQNDDWRGRPWQETVVYELHVGTFTAEGTFRAAIAKLPHLKALGITAIEVMPVAQFGGNRGWGYDGVLLYAPHRAYGSPDDMKAFIDAAHGHGLSVLLDVVYNHFGPDGNYLHALAPGFFHPERHTPWGGAIAYERPAVRAYFLDNVRYWLGEFRLDGLRLDAVDQVQDPDSEMELLLEIAEAIRSEFPGRHIHTMTEDNRNITALHERGDGGAIVRHSGEWNDDFHNAAHVVLTGETDGYYEDFAEAPMAKLARTLAEGFAYQGEPSPHTDDKPRGVPCTHLPPTAFVDFLQNHDQVGNRALGERLVSLTDEKWLRVLTAIHLLSPHIPLLFMGEEWGETSPFFFFTDFRGDLADAVRNGRRHEFAKFAAFRDEERQKQIPDPNAADTFARSRLDWSRVAGSPWLPFYRDLLDIRRSRIVPLLTGAAGHSGSILHADDHALAVDWQFGGARLQLRANLGAEAAKLPKAEGALLFAEGMAGPDETLPPTSMFYAIETTAEDSGAQ